MRERAERIALELEVQQLRRDIGQLRSELDSQRREAARLATELGELRDTVAGRRRPSAFRHNTTKR